MPYRTLVSALLWCLIPCLSLVSACQGYDYTVNERVVYSPAPLLRDVRIPDPALRDCVEQVISDRSVTDFEQLLSLNCSHAGIESLDGLAVFNQLTHLRLSSNRIRNLVELHKLAELRELYLDHNRVVDPVPLYILPNLRVVDLSDNPDLQCPDPGSFAGVEQVIPPAHCDRQEPLAP